jgi:Fe-S-cluster containining protein
MTMPQFPVKRDQVPPGENLCDHCTALCCRYFAVPMDTPTTWKDFDNIRWFMLHGQVTAYVDDGTWYLCVYADCRHLQADHRCGIYHDRPEICREYSTNRCEYDDRGTHDRLFETPEQVWEYAQAVLPPKRSPRRNGQTNGKLSLPILH